MTDRLTDAEIDRLDAVLDLPQQYDWEPDTLTIHAECRYQDYSNGPDSSVVRDDSGEVVAVLDYDAGGDYVARLAVAAHNALPALLAEVREHRAREDAADLALLREAYAADDGARIPLNAFMARLERVREVGERIAQSDDPDTAAHREYPEFFALLDATEPDPDLPPHPGIAGLAAREDAASAKIVREAPEKRESDILDIRVRITTTAADITRAADDDSDHVRSVFD